MILVLVDTKARRAAAGNHPYGESASRARRERFEVEAGSGEFALSLHELRTDNPEMADDTLLKPQWFHILLALSQEPRHGFGIQRAVLERTGGRLRLWPATLYRSIEALSREGLIEAVDTPAGEPEDERRQYYRLTGDGERRLALEVGRIRAWLEDVPDGILDRAP